MKIDESRDGVIKVKSCEDGTCQVEIYTSLLTQEQIDFFKHLPPYYEQVNLEYWLIDDENSDNYKIIINRAMIFIDDTFKLMTQQDLNEWFYHSSTDWIPTIINGINKC